MVNEASSQLPPQRSALLRKFFFQLTLCLAAALLAGTPGFGMGADSMMGGGGRPPPKQRHETKDGQKTEHEDAADTKVLIEGKITLAPALAKAAAGLREVDVEIYLPDATSKAPYAWTKFFIKKDAEGDFLPFALMDGKLHIIGSVQPLTVFDVKAKLISTGLIGLDGAGDLTGVTKGVKSGSESVQITIDTAH